MLAFDVFTDERFQATELREVTDNIVYIPQTLNQMNLFEADPIRTTTVTVYQGTEGLEFIPTTERGSPRVLPGRDSKRLVQLETVNLRQEDRINAGEVQNIVNEFIPFDQALSNADEEVEKRMRKLMRKLEYTREYHRFAALSGFLLDANGSIIYNYFEAFGLVKPAAVAFDFSVLDKGALRTLVTAQVFRPMQRQLQRRGSPVARIGSLCSDSFYDKMLQNPEIYKSYETQQNGAELREQRAWQSFNFAGVEWINYMGTTDNTTIAIPENRCRFFPIGATDVFKEYRSPGEEWNEVNTLGEEFYSYVVPDPRAPQYMAFVDLYLDSHPLFACIAPEVLLDGVAL